jgi:hypothetical protein
MPPNSTHPTLSCLSRPWTQALRQPRPSALVPRAYSLAAMTKAMAPEKRVNRNDALLAIHAHLAQTGPRDWKPLRARLSDVPARTFWRWVAEAKAVPAPAPQIEAARDRLRRMSARTPSAQSCEPGHLGAADIASHVPAPPPAVIAKDGGLAKALDLLVELRSLWRDAYALREAAIVRREGTERIVNALLYDRRVVARLKLIETGAAVRRELWDLERMEAFYTTIIETVAGAAPEVAQEIQRRLAALNIRAGMTCDVDGGC